jgi:hypothetical protein
MSCGHLLPLDFVKRMPPLLRFLHINQLGLRRIIPQLSWLAY